MSFFSIGTSNISDMESTIMVGWEAAYVAGIIDGEGSISLTRMHENEHRLLLH